MLKILGLLVLLGSMDVSQARYFDLKEKRCVPGEDPRFFHSPLRSCFTGQLSSLNFLQTQKIPGLETLYLTGASSDFSNLSHQKLENVFLDYASLKQISLSYSKLIHTSFERADLRGGRIRYSEFINFSFKNADLRGIKIYRSKFSGGDFLGAKLGASVITDSEFEDCFYDKEFFKDAQLINVSFKNCRVRDERGD